MKYESLGKLARRRFQTLFSNIEYHLDKFKCLDLDNLQQIYKKLKKQEERTDFVCALPVIGKIKYNTMVHTYVTSDYVLKIAKFMDTLGLEYINDDIYKTLQEQQDELYLTYFKEDYEAEVRASETKHASYDILFNNDQEKE